MRTSGINNINFRSVTPIITKRGNLPKIEKQLLKHVADRGFELVDATALYSSVSNNRGILWKAVNKAKYDVGLLITGDEYKKWVCSAPGWRSLSAAAERINGKQEMIANGKAHGSVLKKLISKINE